MDKLSVTVNDTAIHGHFGSYLFNHLCYADDMCFISISSTSNRYAMVVILFLLSTTFCIMEYCVMEVILTVF